MEGKEEEIDDDDDDDDDDVGKDNEGSISLVSIEVVAGMESWIVKVELSLCWW